MSQTLGDLTFLAIRDMMLSTLRNTMFFDNRIQTHARTATLAIGVSSGSGHSGYGTHGDEIMAKTTRKVMIDFDKLTATGTAHSGDLNYTVVMHFNDTAQMVRAAFEKCVIETNIDARAGKIKNGETYNTDCWGEIHKTDDQLLAELSPALKDKLRAQWEAEQAAAAAAAVEAKKQTKKAA